MRCKGDSLPTDLVSSSFRAFSPSLLLVFFLALSALHRYVLLFKKKAGALDPHAAPSKATKPKKKKMPSINDLFDVLDANGDGTLTRYTIGRQ